MWMKKCLIGLLLLNASGAVFGFFDWKRLASKAGLAIFGSPSHKEASERPPPKHNFALKYPLRIKLSENGDSENFELLTVTQEDCDLSSSSKKLSEVILSKSSNPAFFRDSQLFTSSGDEVHHCTDLDVYKQHQRLIMQYTHGKIVEEELAKNCPSTANHTHGHVFHVPRGRLFIWPTYELGHRTMASNVALPSGYKPIVVETLSAEPRVFKVYNFFTEEESDILIKNALEMKGEDYRLKRSSTGTNGYNIDTYRTSENAFDTTSEVAIRLKKRCFELLGMHPYNEHWADGLQILRYNVSTAYINHLDYIESESTDHDWDSAKDGTNRFATILLYMSDVEDGGETFFPEATNWFVSAEESPEFSVSEEGAYASGVDESGPRLSSCVSSEVQEDCRDPSSYGYIEHPIEDEEFIEEETALYLEEKNISHLFKKGSWQRDMVKNCRSKMSVRPMKAHAVLFYSQKPLGEKDVKSMHGACPVLQGVKWAANLWVWNGPRQPYLKQQKQYRNWKNSRERNEYIPKESSVQTPESDNSAVEGLFRNVDLPQVFLYWNEQLITPIDTGEAKPINTFKGHSFTVKLNDKTIQTLKVGNNGQKQSFDISKESVALGGVHLDL